MNLKERQQEYNRFQSKLESAVYRIVDNVVQDTNTTVDEEFINTTLAPDVWEYLNKKLPELVKKHSVS